MDQPRQQRQSGSTGSLSAPTPGSTALVTPSPVLRMEANFLRFPFFALGTKGLKKRKGFLVEGSNKDGVDFSLRITCNCDDLYPGPLARRVHHQLVAHAMEQGIPFDNPIRFTWGQLARRLGDTIGGDKVRRYKDAIASVQGNRIRTKSALKDHTKQYLKSRERGYQLYSEYIFLEDELPNGTIADVNYVFLADWYYANLCGLYVAPINFQLWSAMDADSPTASRIYEFLAYNFSGNWKTFCINYRKLCQFLPIAPQRYESLAQQKLVRPFKILQDFGVISSVNWKTGKSGDLQLVFARGRVLDPKGPPAEWITSSTPEIETVEVTELLRQSDPAVALVTEFHALWTGAQQYIPDQKELAFARSLLNRVPQPKLERLLPSVIELMREHHKLARTFSATKHYWHGAEEQIQKSEAAAKRKKQQLIE